MEVIISIIGIIVALKIGMGIALDSYEEDVQRAYYNGFDDGKKYVYDRSL